MKCPLPEVNASGTTRRVNEVTYTPMVPKVETEPGAGDAPTSRGRPRAAGRSDEILRATIDLVDEVGYDQLRIQDVADRAGAGLATIYRRWPTKQALVADAIRHKSETVRPEPTGDPAVDLRTLILAVAEHACGRKARFLPGLLAAVGTEPELEAAFREHFVEGVRADLRATIAAIHGEDFPQLDLLTDMVPGVLLFRSLVPGTPDVAPADYADEVLALVLAGGLPAGERR
jgi:AcrR family transcriptional regulator